MLISEEERDKRLDLTNSIIFTIDSDEAYILDDALSIEKLENGNFYVGIHIADVSFLIKHNSEIDLEARKRNKKLYLHFRSINMVPEDLAKACSLTPDFEKCTFSIF